MNHSINQSYKGLEKEQIKQIFNDIAYRYDIVNSVMSLGMHHYWRKQLIRKANIHAGLRILDVCCGTGKITFDLARQTGPSGYVFGVDLSEQMLAIAQQHLSRSPFQPIVEFKQADTQCLPFPDNLFDRVTIGYGLRNVPNIQTVLKELMRVVKPGGLVVSLEMAKPYSPIFKGLYQLYLKKWIPFIGKILVHNRPAYQYLHDSIQSFPHQNLVTKYYQDIGYINIECSPLSWGIVAIHRGQKP